MSNDQIDEYEQGERVRKWLRDNGGSLFGGIALGLAAIYGFQAWQARGDAHRVEASTGYDGFVDALEAGEADKANGLALNLAANFADTPYPALAALRQASSLLREGKAEEALKAIEPVIPATADPALRQTLMLRAARAEVVLGRHDAALQRLAGVDLAALAGLRHEIEGDALAAQGKRDEARAAYEKALTGMDSTSPLRRLVEMKLAEAGGTPTTPEA